MKDTVETPLEGDGARDGLEVDVTGPCLVRVAEHCGDEFRGVRGIGRWGVGGGADLGHAMQMASDSVDETSLRAKGHAWVLGMFPRR